MHSSFENTTYIDHESQFLEKNSFFFKCSYFVIFILLIRYIIDIVRNFKKCFSLHTLLGMISSLLQLVGPRLRVYYTLTNYRGTKEYANDSLFRSCDFLSIILTMFNVLKMGSV